MGRIRVAKLNGNILTDSSKDLAFDSNQENLIIVNERIDTFTESASSHMETIAHGLNYRPTIKIYEEMSSGVWTKYTGLMNIWADTTNINYELYAGSSPHRIKTIIIANSQNGAVAGTLNNANGRLQIAKSGYDLNNITDLRQFAFSSQKGCVMLNEKKTIDVVCDGTPDTTFQTQYAHGLGYIPQFEAVLSSTGVVIPYFELAGAGASALFDVEVDATYIRCKVTDSGGAISAQTISFRVHILCGKIE